MASRAANATIKGYYYQFDTSILKLIELDSDTDSVTIEGIEDIDVKDATETTCVQCKYLSKPKFINSAVREPIILMISNFIKSSDNLKYTLYAHFEEEISGIEREISLVELKEILTYSENKQTKSYHNDNGISDDQLKKFLENFKLIFGKKFEQQQLEVIDKLKAHFKCTTFEADTLYYNNALRVIIDKAIKKTSGERAITKADFISAIDNRQQLFNEWYVVLRSKKEFLKSTSEIIKQTQSNYASKTKYLFIGNNILDSNNQEFPILAFIEYLIHKYYRMNNALRTSKPISFILDADRAFVRDLKINLINKGIHFNDGYEEINFNPDSFNADPVINLNRSLTKISKSSFFIKLVSKSKFERHIGQINRPRIVFNFSNNNCPYTPSQDYQLFDIKCCENLKDIATLL